MHLRFCSIMLVAALGGGCGPAVPSDRPQPDRGRVLIIAAEGLVEAGQAYAAFRRAQGFAVTVVGTARIQADHPGLGLAEAIAEQVRAFDWDEAPRAEPYLLLLGDANALAPDALDRVPVAVGRGEGEGFSWREYGDAPYGDLDEDGIPDVSIGRLPFRQPAQLEAYRSRAEAYERTYRPGVFNKTMSAFAGEGGFGPEIDGLLELATGWVFDEMSYDFDMSMTYASDASAYYLPPAAWDVSYAERYQAGAVLMPYIGHTLGRAACCGDRAPARRGLLAFFSCGDGSFQDGGDFDPHQSLAERVLLDPHGPIASMGATAMSHPYGNAILPRELGHAILDLREPTWGRALRTAQRNMVERIDDLRLTIDAAAEPYCTEPLDQLVFSHIVLYNLLGDPTMPLKLPPAEVRFAELEGDLLPGQTVRIRGRVRGDAERGAPGDGRIEVTLEVRRTVICRDLLPRDPSDHDPDTCRANHAAANDKVLARAEGEVEDGAFAVDLAVPAGLEEEAVYLKGFAWDDRVDAVGSSKVVVGR